MPAVRVRENEPFDVTLRRFKRACERAGLLAEIHRREYYENSAEEKKRKAIASMRRRRRDLSRRQRNQSRDAF